MRGGTRRVRACQPDRRKRNTSHTTQQNCVPFGNRVGNMTFMRHRHPVSIEHATPYVLDSDCTSGVMARCIAESHATHVRTDSELRPALIIMTLAAGSATAQTTTTLVAASPCNQRPELRARIGESASHRSRSFLRPPPRGKAWTQQKRADRHPIFVACPPA